MANWYGTARSNYFKVKNITAFREWCELNSLHIEEEEDMADTGPFVAIFPNDCGSGGWPSIYPIDEITGEPDHDAEPLDFVDELQQHLAENNVAILVEVGSEKSRYITGIATAIPWEGECVQIDLYNIVSLARAKFGPDCNITQPEY